MCMLLPSTIAASYLIESGVLSCDNSIIRRGTIPCEITNVFCLSLPITTFFRQINDSWTLLSSSWLYKSSIYEREQSTSYGNLEKQNTNTIHWELTSFNGGSELTTKKRKQHLKIHRHHYITIATISIRVLT